MSITDRQGLIPKAGIKVPCVAIASSNITLSGLQTIDGKTVTESQRVLCSGQTAGEENGPWLASTSAWTRPPDFNSNEEIDAGVLVPVYNNLGSSGVYQIQFAGALSLGTTSLTVTAVEGSLVDEDNMASNSATSAPSQQSVVAYLATELANLLIDEDAMGSNSDTKAPTQQSVVAYIAAQLYSLPTVTGNAFKFLMSDGSVDGESWEALSDNHIQYCRIGVNANESIAANGLEQLINLVADQDTNSLFASDQVTAPFTGLMLVMAVYAQDNGGPSGPVHPVIRIDGTDRHDWSTISEAAPPESSLGTLADAFIVNNADVIQAWGDNPDTDNAIDIIGDAALDQSFITFIFIRGAF